MGLKSHIYIYNCCMSKQSQAFQKLTPNSDLQENELGIYKDALDYALSDQNDDITNIAVSGGFGTGRGSIVYSYFNLEENKKHNPIYISVSHNNSRKNEEPKKTPANIKEEIKEKEYVDKKCYETTSNLQELILNQLVHNIKIRNIPLSKLNLRRNFSGWKKIGLCILLFPFTLSGLILLTKANFFKNHLGDMSFLFLNIPIDSVPIIVLVVFIVTGTILLLLFAYWFSKKILRSTSFRVAGAKLGAGGISAETSFFDQKEDLPFDIWFDEIFYLVRKAKTNIFVFEDLDRFNNEQIFIELRQLNKLLNDKLKANFVKERKLRSRNPKPIKFIYLLDAALFFE